MKNFRLTGWGGGLNSAPRELVFHTFPDFIMARICIIRGTQVRVGGRIHRSGLAKKKGGIGMHVVKNVKRTFSPNVQKIRIRDGASVRRARVCTACIRSNRIAKA